MPAIFVAPCLMAWRVRCRTAPYSQELRRQLAEELATTAVTLAWLAPVSAVLPVYLIDPELLLLRDRDAFRQLRFTYLVCTCGEEGVCLECCQSVEEDALAFVLTSPRTPPRSRVSLAALLPEGRFFEWAFI